MSPKQTDKPSAKTRPGYLTDLSHQSFVDPFCNRIRHLADSNLYIGRVEICHSES